LARLSHEDDLEKKIDFRFADGGLLREALTHKSYSNEHPEETAPFNERLEFLGDAVLDLVVSDTVFRSFPELAEGELTRIRAEVVSEKSLAAIGRSLELGECLRLGRGEQRSGGRDKDSLLADALEALLGAVFCDGGLESVRPIVDRLFSEAIAFSARHKVGVDHKTRLQEVLQARHGRTPSYELVRAEGPDHQRLYTVAVHFGGESIGQGTGRTKKKAEQAAACEALRRLGE
jgi:ribonuclease-3